MIDDWELWAQLRTVLAQLELVSSAATCNYDPDGGGGESDGVMTSVTAPHQRYIARLDGIDRSLRRRLDAAEAEGDTDQRETEEAKAHDWAHAARVDVLNAARDELKSLTGRDGETPRARVAQLDTEVGIERVIREEAPGKPADDVAAALNVSIFVVRRIYVADGLYPHDGSPIDNGESPRERALAMRERYTVRQIALVLKVPKSTVHDWLRRVA